MREMKDSGIEWVGQIPSTWTIKPIRAEFEEVTRKNSNGGVKTALKFTYGNIVKKNNFDADEDAYVADTILPLHILTFVRLKRSIRDIFTSCSMPMTS